MARPRNRTRRRRAATRRAPPSASGPARGRAGGRARSPSGLARCAEDPLVMQHRGKRIIEMVQELLPSLVLRRLAEALLVRGHAVPSHQQEVVAFALDASLQL